MSNLPWTLTLVHRDNEGCITAKIKLHGERLGEILGEAMHAGVRWEQDDGEGPIETLKDIVTMFGQNYCTYEDDGWVLLEQLLLQVALDDTIHDRSGAILEAMAALAMKKPAL